MTGIKVNLNKRLKQKDNAILVINITLGKSIKKTLKVYVSK